MADIQRVSNVCKDQKLEILFLFFLAIKSKVSQHIYPIINFLSGSVGWFFPFSLQKSLHRCNCAAPEVPEWN